MTNLGPDGAVTTFAESLAHFAQTQPDLVFARSATKEIRYSEACTEVEKIAAWLQGQDFFEKNRPIFTFLPAQAEYLTTFLGAMQSGMPWVGLDPNFPSSMNASILDVSDRANVICANRDRERLNDLIPAARLITIEDIWASDRDGNCVLPNPEDIALITFTSGSSGKPKGVARSQRDVFANASGQAARYSLCSADTVVAGYSVSVMGFLRAFLNTLSVGGCYRPVDLRSHDENGLLAAMDEETSSLLHIVAPVFRTLFGTLHYKRQFSSIKRLILGGDAATPTDLELFRKHFRFDAKIYSGLGSSECGTISIWEGRRDYFPEREKLPCGDVLEGVDIFLNVEGELIEPMPDLVGELFVSSPYMAHSYWNDQDLSDEKWAVAENGKIYCRTGDLVALDHFGVLHHFGRADQVVKVNGMLVDPALVEHVVAQYPGVTEVAVETQTVDASGKRVIEAFVAHEDSCELSDLERFLEENLVPASHPKFWYRMPELPRGKSGKVLRIALDRNNPFTWRRTSRPKSASKTSKLKRIWRSILLVKDFPADANFFELGGDSLSTIALAMQIEQNFGFKVSIEDILKEPRFAQMERKLLAKQNLQSIKSFSLADLKKKRIGKQRKGDSGIDPVVGVRNQVELWGAECIGDEGILVQRAGASGPPLYWGLQGKDEFHQISRNLENDVTVRGIKSMNFVCPKTPKNMDRLATAYAASIIELTGNLKMPVYLGGFCQGATMLFEVANKLLALGQSIGHFISLEKYIEQHFPVPTTFVFGTESERNMPRVMGLNVENVKPFYPYVSGIHEIAGRHGDIFYDHKIGPLVQHIKRAMQV
ncbi:MAG: AMP-binding protein [Pseudomonadota bacterium]